MTDTEVKVEEVHLTRRERIHQRLVELRRTAPPVPTEWSTDRRCDSCKHGYHSKCTGVDCYNCTDIYHEQAGSRGIGLNPRGLIVESAGPKRARLSWADW